MSVPWEAEEFERFLRFLRDERGLDFTGYKRASVARRVSRRMQAAEAGSLSDYMDRLEVDPQEFVQLLNTILINVTGFFRDAPAWEFLSKEILPEIIAHRDPNALIRLWSAGCASGEEAYSLAMVLAEALGEAEFTNRVKIYATDIDEEALGQARRATYTQRELEGVPEALVTKYFRQSGAQYTFHPELRRAVIFGLHNLLTDAPISNLDLLVCRNTLMYFNAESQRRVIAFFHFAIQNTGFLFLGKAEMLQISAPLFAPVNVRYRIFRKVPSAAGAGPPAAARDRPHAGGVSPLDPPAGDGGGDAAGGHPAAWPHGGAPGSGGAHGGCDRGRGARLLSSRGGRGNGRAAVPARDRGGAAPPRRDPAAGGRWRSGQQGTTSASF